MSRKTSFMILAGGLGSRFGSNPKVLTKICGLSCIDHIIHTIQDHPIVVVTTEKIAPQVNAPTIIQEKPNGTGHAFQIGLQGINSGQNVFVIFGDSPLITKSTIEAVLNKVNHSEIVFGMFRSSKPNHYGRIVKVNDQYNIVEYVDHPESTEFYNAGWMCFNSHFIDKIKQNINTLARYETSEFYLTEYLKYGQAEPVIIDETESIGINTINDYIDVRQVINLRLISKLMCNGVYFTDPNSVSISFDTEIGPDSIVEGHVNFGPGVKLGSNNRIMSYTILEHIITGSNCHLGPFTYIQDTTIDHDGYIGSFCEVKRSKIGAATKAKHLSYIGDAEIGNSVNIGAGNVFCNYNGVKKSKCIIEDKVFLGGNCTYVAPVVVGKGAYVGAGTVVRQKIEPGILYVANPSIIEYKK